MENTNTNTPVKFPKSRRTYVLAGIPCLCWEGSLFAPLSGVSANLGQIQVSPGEDPSTVKVVGAAGEETWHCESRESIKARGASARKPKPKAQPVAESEAAEPGALSDAIAAVRKRQEDRKSA
jgi:hypothetical protein